MSWQPAPGTELGGYVISTEIGRGGMSTVYLAEQISLGRKVALKILSADLAEDDEFRRRFVKESRLAAGLEHPNIVPVYDAGEAEDGDLVGGKATDQRVDHFGFRPRPR